MLESLPGGIESLREMVNDFAKFGVRVLLPYLPWDQGTPRKPGQSDIVSLIDLIIRTNSSGMNGMCCVMCRLSMMSKGKTLSPC